VPPGIDDCGPPLDAEESESRNVEIRYKTSENNKAILVAIADKLKAIGVTTTFVKGESAGKASDAVSVVRAVV
jgi:hypothetical protein